MLLLAVVACGDTVAPGTDVLTVRIAGPDTAGPQQTVTLVGSAERTLEGAVPDSLLTWFLGDSLAQRGAQISVRMGDTGSVTVRLSVAVARDTAEAVHTTTVRVPGTILWRVDLEQAGAYPSDIAVTPNRRVIAWSYYRGAAAAIDPGPRLVWFQLLGSSSGESFAVRPDGGYVHRAGPLTAYSALGDSLWSFAGATVYYYAVAANGAVRFIGPGVAGGLSPDGTLQWIDSSNTLGNLRGIAVDGAGRSYVVSGASRLDVSDSAGTPLAGGAVGLPATCNTAADVVPVGNGAVLLSSSGSSASCLSRVDWSTRAVAWTWIPAGSTGSLQPAVAADGTMFIALQSGSIVHLAENGSQLWRSPGTTECPDTAAANTPALGLDGTVFTSTGGRVTAVRADGTVRWTTDVASGNTDDACDAAAPSLTHDGRVIIMRPGFVVAALAAGSSADTTAIWNQWRGGPERHQRANAR